MSIGIGIGIGVFICYWLKVNAQAKQELVIKQAQNDILLAALAKNPSILDVVEEAKRAAQAQSQL